MRENEKSCQTIKETQVDESVNIPEEITTSKVQAPLKSEYQTILSILDKGEILANEIEEANRVIEDELEKHSTLEKESKGSGQHYSFRSNNSLRKRAHNFNEFIQIENITT